MLDVARGYKVSEPIDPKSYPRDMPGYGAEPPKVSWPGGNRIAVQFVINYEEGGENNVLHGDDGSGNSSLKLLAQSLFRTSHEHGNPV